MKSLDVPLFQHLQLLGKNRSARPQQDPNGVEPTSQYRGSLVNMQIYNNVMTLVPNLPISIETTFSPSRIFSGLL